MTDCNDNQLVVKAQIENDCAASPDQQVAMADQPTAWQTAPAAPSEVQPSEQSTATTAPGLSLAGIAPDVSHEVTIGTNESDNLSSTDLDLQTLGAGATLSDLDRIGRAERESSPPLQESLTASLPPLARVTKISSGTSI